MLAKISTTEEWFLWYGHYYLMFNVCALHFGLVFLFLKKIPNISYVTEKILIDDSLSVFANTYKKNISIGKYLNKNEKNKQKHEKERTFGTDTRASIK